MSLTSFSQMVLDQSFGSNGVRVTDNDILPTEGFFVNNQYVFFGNQSRFARYHYNGEIDYTFGNFGFSVISVPGRYAYFKNALEHNGKFYGVGRTESQTSGGTTDAAIVRLNENGQIDTTFGVNGVVQLNLGAIEVFENIIINDDGTIFATGYQESPAHSFSAILCKFLANGSPDLSFNGTGTKIISYGYGSYGVAIFPYEGKLLVGSYFREDLSAKIVLQKIDLNGNIMNDFGTNGVLQFSLNVPGSSSIKKMKLIGNKIYISYYYGLSFNLQGYGLAAFNLSTPQQSLFDIGISPDSYFSVLPDGKILVARGINCINPSCSSTSFTVYRYNADGSADTTFANNGTFTHDQSPSSSSREGATFVYAHNDGRILIAGTSTFCCPTSPLVMLRIGDIALDGSDFNKSSFMIYPNPANESFTIRNDADAQIEKLSVIDVLGKVIPLFARNPNQVDISGLNTGVYILEIVSDGRTYRTRLVKS